MKHEAEIKDLLVNNAIHLIADGGFEMATTKALTYSGGEIDGVRMNEVYIYRLYGSKENLYDAAFEILDNEIATAFRKGLAFAYRGDGDVRERMFRFFLLAWEFILGNEERCRCYVRYYYSIYFKGKSLESHKKLFEGMISELSHLFREEADVVSILHSVFTALLDFCIRVYNGDLEDSEINRPHVFNVLYCMMSSYFAAQVSAP